MTVSVDIDWSPWPSKVAEDYFAVGERVEDLAPEFHEVMRYLEAVHTRGFARLKGRYIRTGATMRSLTGPGPGAIRDVEDQMAVFGTSVWYAHFLSKAPEDPNLGQPWKTGAKSGNARYAVLFFSRTTKRKIAEMLLSYAVEPFGD